MDEALQRAQELVAEWDEEMRRELPLAGSVGCEAADARPETGDASGVARV